MKKFSFIIVLLALGLIVCSSAWAEDLATKDECVAMCEKAAKIGAEKGADELIRLANDPKGPFVWKDSYIYVANFDTKLLLAHPFNAALINKNIANIKDVNGKMFFLEILNMAKEQGSGWIEYMWPKPGEKVPVPKASYVLRVPGQPLAVIAGAYL